MRAQNLHHLLPISNLQDGANRANYENQYHYCSYEYIDARISELSYLDSMLVLFDLKICEKLFQALNRLFVLVYV